jgi:DNA invertase Pin-like site-specific DNA recombinase
MPRPAEVKKGDHPVPDSHSYPLKPVEGDFYRASIHAKDSAALAEFERELIRERTLAGLASARPFTMTMAKLNTAQAAMAKRDTRVGDLCRELGITRQTLYRFVGPKGELRADGKKLLKRRGQ